MSKTTKLLLIAAGIVLCALALFYLYLRRGNPLTEEEKQLVRTTLALRPGIKVGEIGAGRGELTVAAAAAVAPEGTVYSTEVEPKLLDEIKSRSAAAGHRNVVVLQAGEKGTNLPADCCDVLFMREVYHHLDNPAAVMADLYRALRSGGRLLVIEFEATWTRRLRSPLAKVPAHRAGHGINEEVLISEVTRAGFVVERPPSPWPGKNYSVLFRKPGMRD